MAGFNIEKLDAREKWGLVAAACLVAVLLVDRLVIATVSKRLDALDREIAGREEELHRCRAFVRAGPEVEAAFAALGKDLVGDASSAERVDEIKGRLDDLARETGVMLVSMEHRAPVEKDAYVEYVIDIGKFETTNEGLLRFLDGIQAAPGLLRVRKLALKPGAQPGTVEGTAEITRVIALAAP